jgi:transposase-like protein
VLPKLDSNVYESQYEESIEGKERIVPELIVNQKQVSEVVAQFEVNPPTIITPKVGQYGLDMGEDESKQAKMAQPKWTSLEQARKLAK